MKRLIIMVLVAVAAISPASAGDGDRHLGFQAGVFYPGVLGGTLSVDYETRYHNAWEVYLDAFTEWADCGTCGKVCRDSFWKSNYGLGIGGAYKPTVWRSRNSTGRARMGADIGTCSRAFSMGVELGYEHVWTLRGGWQLVLQQKNEVTFWGGPTWRFGGMLGIRLPL